MILESIFVVAAGSGGHMLPAATLAKQWKDQHPQSSVIFITGTTPLEKRIVHEQPCVDHVKTIDLTKFSTRQWYLLPLIIAQMAWGFIKALVWLTRYKPSKVITTGGLHALPVGYAAWVLRYPLKLYELNVIPGRAIEALAPVATTTYAVFKATQQYLPTCKPVPYPLRFTEQDKINDPTRLIQHLNDLLRVGQSNDLLFDPSRKTLMILGGSQGSQLLNRLTRQFCMDHKHLLHNVQVIHQTGAFEEHWWKDFYKSVKVPAYTFSYNQRISECYQLADVIVCRAGAGTLFETVFFNRPCIVIPLVADTTDHQVNNAREIALMYPELITVFAQESVVAGQHKLFEAMAERLEPR